MAKNSSQRDINYKQLTNNQIKDLADKLWHKLMPKIKEEFPELNLKKDVVDKHKGYDSRIKKLEEDLAKLQSAPPKSAPKPQKYHIGKELIKRFEDKIQQAWDNETKEAGEAYQDSNEWGIKAENVDDFVMAFWKKSETWENDSYLTWLQTNDSSALESIKKTVKIEVNKRFYTWVATDWREQSGFENDDYRLGKIELDEREKDKLRSDRKAFEPVDVTKHAEIKPFWKNLQYLSKQDQKNKLSFFEPPQSFIDKGEQRGMSKERIREAWKREVMNKKEDGQTPDVVYGSNIPTDYYHLTFD